MKKLLLPFLALALVVGCGQDQTEEVSGSQPDETHTEQEETSIEQAEENHLDSEGELVFEEVGLTDITTFASNTAFELYHVPGVHQIIDEVEEKVYLLVSLPHVAQGTSLTLTDIVNDDDGYKVQLEYTDAEGEKSSMFNEMYALSKEMNSFIAVDQQETVWGTSTVGLDQPFAFDPKFKVDDRLSQNLRISSPGFDVGLTEDTPSLEVTGFALSSDQVIVSLVQGDKVIASDEFSGQANEWTPFTVDLDVEGLTFDGNADDVQLIFEGENIEQTWTVHSFE